MNFKSVLGAIALASCVAAAPAQAAVNLVTNGSFETGVAPGVFTTLGAGSGSLTGWSVTSGSVDYIGSYWQASDLARSLDMAGNSAGAIAQTVSGLTAGARYIVSFDIAGNPDGGPAVKQLLASIGGASLLATFNVAGHSRAAMGWQTNTFSFVAAGSSALLTFATQGAAASPYGPALDNVSVAAAVPEASTWAMMLIGFAGLAALSRRRVRVA